MTLSMNGYIIVSNDEGEPLHHRINYDNGAYNVDIFTSEEDAVEFLREAYDLEEDDPYCKYGLPSEQKVVPCTLEVEV